jgi:Zn-dependent protease
VPVNPVRFNRKVSMSTGMAITAAAGPASNLVLALLSAVALGLLLRFAPTLVAQQKGIYFLLLYGVQLNVGLAIFNMLPLPPLDGSRIVERFIPRRWQDGWANFARVGPFVLFAVIASGGMFLSGPISAVSEGLFGLIKTIAHAGA